MAKATVKDGVLYIEVPYNQEGKKSASRKNLVHATTENGTPDALKIRVGSRDVVVQVNAYSMLEKQLAPAAK